ncbi:MAG: hypothetical protein ACYDH5_12030 [Acidimicrobiales bacterium]
MPSEAGEGIPAPLWRLAAVLTFGAFMNTDAVPPCSSTKLRR